MLLLPSLDTVRTAVYAIHYATIYVFEYTSRTVSYTKELTPVPICYYSQEDGFNTPLSRLLHCTVHTKQVVCSVSVGSSVLSRGTVMYHLGRRK